MEAKQFPIIIINGLLSLLLLYYASIQVPFAGLMIGALMPLPTILVIRRAGWIAGLLLVGAGVGVMYYVEHFFGIKAEVLPFLHMALIAFVLSFLASRQYPPGSYRGRRSRSGGFNPGQRFSGPGVAAGADALGIPAANGSRKFGPLFNATG